MYKVTLYSNNGDIIRTWKIDNATNMTTDHGALLFIDPETGKRMYISGTFVAEPILPKTR